MALTPYAALLLLKCSQDETEWQESGKESVCGTPHVSNGSMHLLTSKMEGMHLSSMRLNG